MTDTKPPLVQPRPNTVDKDFWLRTAKNMRLVAAQLDEERRIHFFHQDLSADDLRTLAKLLEEHHAPRYVVNLPEPPMPLWKAITWAAWGVIMLDSVLKYVWGWI